MRAHQGATVPSMALREAGCVMAPCVRASAGRLSRHARRIILRGSGTTTVSGRFVRIRVESRRMRPWMWPRK